MLTEEQLAEYESKFQGCIHAVGARDDAGNVPWEVVVRPPSRPEFKRYRKRLRDPQWAADAIEEMITDAVVYPDRAGFQAMLDRRPAICEGIASIPAVADMLGLTAAASAK